MATDHDLAEVESGARRRESATASPTQRGNALLGGVPPDQLRDLYHSAERVRPRTRQVIYETGMPMEYAWFAEGAVFSLLAEMGDGTVIETLTVGDEGMLGLPAIMGHHESPTRAICQIGGWALRIPMRALTEAAPRQSALFDRLMRYAQAQLINLTQSVACNRLHSAQQRYARWVLATQDRAGTDEFPMTQDFIAQMLGITRPTVSQVSQELQANGIIHYAKGRITIDDRAGLERVACECYGIMRTAFTDLLGESRSG